MTEPSSTIWNFVIIWNRFYFHFNTWNLPTLFEIITLFVKIIKMFVPPVIQSHKGLIIEVNFGFDTISIF